MEARVGQYMRKKGKYPPEEILRRVVLEPTGKENRLNLDGDLLNFTSVRMRTFALSGVKCVQCGLEGKYFVKERSFTKKAPEKLIYHLNLYAIDKDGREVLMTHDHIRPRSKGGSNKTSNTQTMCFRCNGAKGDKWEPSQEIKCSTP